MTRPLVVLFDIDETLVHTGDRAPAAGRGRSTSCTGCPPTSARTPQPGKPIPKSVAKPSVRCSGDPSHDEMARLYAKYLWHLAEDIWTAQGYRVLDGAEDLRRRLGDAGVMLGVISVAMEGPARTKMEHSTSTSSSAPTARTPRPDEVTRLAIAKAARLHGSGPRHRRGVRRRRHPPRHHLRPSGATASGHYDAEQLQAAHPEQVLGSLTEPFPGLPTTPSSSNDS
jgi:phosphoglycolate phosphatase